MSYQATDWAQGLMLPRRQKAVLLCLAHHHNRNTGLCCPSIALIAKETGNSERTVKRALAELKHTGLIHSKARRRAGEPISNSYQLLINATMAPTAGPKCQYGTDLGAILAHKQGISEQGTETGTALNSASENPLAEPTLKDTGNSGQANPEMTTAKDVLDKFSLKGIQAKGAAALVVRWKQHMAETTGEFQGELTQKEKGQLKQFGQKMGDKALVALDYAIANWAEFAVKTKKAAGLLTIPTKPHTGFLLAHVDVLAQMMYKPAQLSVTTPKSFHKPAAVVHSGEKTPDPADKPMTEAEKQAAYEKAMAILNSKN
ncbi:helix-turn-helix domain-containing protein [Burkholderia sp. AU6039]|uniref:helix-turn-helix domain-containing protein n=1 Tax=Burkholderia sp. AU6039 TaxID=2015344 RepID=UPI000B7A8F26|nr:helix-turn-helix domain-containing protein [Burkholderia sp. AU6039]OXJ21304.1 hypothetical protein CFB39_01255 [Burkholderia sp. AU6039]